MFEINWQDIKENFPNGYEKFINFLGLHGYTIYDGCETDICYCDIESFFDELGIIIYIFHDTNRLGQKLKYCCFKIYYKNIYYESNFFDTRNEAKLSAVKKAFEILEKQLEEIIK